MLQKGRWEGEIEGFRKDGTPATIHMAANIVFNENVSPSAPWTPLWTSPIGKKMEEELRIKDFAIASSIYGIGMGDLEGNITYINNAALQMWGADNPSEVIGRSALELARDKDQAEQILLEMLTKGSWEGEIEGFRKDGTPATIHMAANIVFNENGEPICTMDSSLTSPIGKKWRKSFASRILPSHRPFRESLSVI